jgi:hypothetical protein
MNWKEFFVIILALVAYDLIVRKVVVKSLEHHFDSAFDSTFEE